MIEVIKVESKKNVKDFVMFPFELYKDCEYWVPPIINEEIDAMDTNKNPVFKNAEAEFYLAYKDNKIVGRVAAIVNWVEIEEQKKNKLRFNKINVIRPITFFEINGNNIFINKNGNKINTYLNKYYSYNKINHNFGCIIYKNYQDSLTLDFLLKQVNNILKYVNLNDTNLNEPNSNASLISFSNSSRCSLCSCLRAFDHSIAHLVLQTL